MVLRMLFIVAKVRMNVDFNNNVIIHLKRLQNGSGPARYNSRLKDIVF